MKKLVILIAACLMQSSYADTTILFDDRVTTIAQVLADPNDLWVKPVDLPAVNGFDLKPEGACFKDLCVPVKQDRDSDLFIRRSGQAWFNVTGLSRKLSQSYVHDHEAEVFSFAQLPVARNQLVRDHVAPDFSVSDRKGNPVTLSAFKNKKVLMITWASW